MSYVKVLLIEQVQARSINNDNMQTSPKFMYFLLVDKVVIGQKYWKLEWKQKKYLIQRIHRMTWVKLQTKEIWIREKFVIPKMAKIEISLSWNTPT